MVTPGGFPLRPQVVEKFMLACGVHALPEALVAIDRHLASRCRVVHGSLLEEHLGRARHEAGYEVASDDHESAVDVVACDAFLMEVGHAVALDDEFAEAREGMDRGNGDGAVGATVLGQQFRDVHIRHAVAICQEEIGIGGLKGFGSFPDASPGSCFSARVDKRDFPTQTLKHLSVLLEIIGKDFFEIAEAENEATASKGRIPLHDMPQNGVSPDFYHRFGRHLRDVAEARTLATAEDHDGRHFFGWLTHAW